jgi:hypothetical protein
LAHLFQREPLLGLALNPSRVRPVEQLISPPLDAVTSHVGCVLGLLLAPGDGAGYEHLGHLVRVFGSLLGTLA